MDMTILVPNHSDLRMIKMVNSIDFFSNKDHRVELLIALNNPTNEVKKQAERIKEKYGDKFEVRIIELTVCNLGYVYNEGFKNAKYDNIFIIDTDMVCKKGSIKKMVNAMGKEMIVKGKILFEDTNSIIRAARMINTTNVVEPYIPAIIINRNVFLKLKKDFMFAVDTVWCADAEFANRILNEKIKVIYTEEEFYHDRITIKKDLKDAFCYGFGKAIRIKRTKEEWKPLEEIIDMYRRGKKNELSLIQQIYSILWITLLEIACGIQKKFNPFFRTSLPFSESASIRDVIKKEDAEEYI